MKAPSGRYYGLDAMRGVAAFLVVAYHFKLNIPGGEWVVPRGYLAVDFFLLLSGFVIARAYEGRLRTGLSLGQFFKIRLVRLYPLYLAGLALGCVMPVLRILVHNHSAPEIDQLLGWAGLNAAFLPAVGWDPPSLFPLNAPSWSLFFEIVINLAYAALLVRARWFVLAGAAAISGAVLVFGAIQHQTLDLGWGWQTFGYGLARTVCSFSLGVLAFRLGAGRRRTMTAWVLAPMIALAAALTAPLDAAVELPLVILTVLVGFPLMVWWAAGMEPTPVLKRACALSGDISYPLYALHYPLMGMFMSLAGVSYASAAIFLVIAVVGAYIALKFYDEPVRRWLSSKSDDGTDGRKAVAAAVKQS